MREVQAAQCRISNRPNNVSIDHLNCRQGVIGGDTCASSNGKTLIHRQTETVQPWEPRRLRLTPKIRYGSGTKVEPTPKETRSIRGAHK